MNDDKAELPARLDENDSNNHPEMDNNDDDQDVVDETPDFLSPDDAVEVVVDNENVPMDEDDDDDDILQRRKEEGDDVAMDDSTTARKDMSCCQIRTHTGPVYSVASVYEASTGTLSILSGGGDDVAYLHRVTVSTAQGMPAAAAASVTSHKLEHAHTDSVSSVAWNLPFVNQTSATASAAASNNNTGLFQHRYAAVGAYDGAIVVYHADTGAKLFTLQGPTDVEWLAWHPMGGQVLLAGSASDGTVWMYHVPREQCLQVFVGHDSGAVVSAGDFTPNGKTALSASADGTLRLWAPRTGQAKAVLRVGGHDPDAAAGLTCMATGGGAEGQLVMVGAENGQAHICHVAGKKVVASLLHHDIVHPQVPNEPDNGNGEEQQGMDLSVEAVGFASTAVNANWCATGGVDGVLKIWDMTTHQCRHVCSLASVPDQDAAGESESSTDASKRTSNYGITKLQWHPTQPLVFCSSCDGNVYVWDTRNGQCVYKATGHTDVITAMDIQFVQDNAIALITTGSEDETVRVFQVNVPALLQHNTTTPATTSAVSTMEQAMT